MSRHRIFRSEADEPKPLAYLHAVPRGRRRAGSYAAAALAGGATVIALAAVLALVWRQLPI